jgi:hypothetical protein
METALKQAALKIGPEVRFKVTAEEVEVRGRSGTTLLPLPILNKISGEQTFSTYRFRLTRLSDGNIIRFEVCFFTLSPDFVLFFFPSIV